MSGLFSRFVWYRSILAQRKASCALIDKLAEALDANVRREGSENKTKLTAGITVDGLSYAYEGRKACLAGCEYDLCGRQVLCPSWARPAAAKARC